MTERKRYTTDPVAIARAALARGPLVRSGKGWRLHRPFRPLKGREHTTRTVNQLVQNGEAKREGDKIVKVDQ